MKYYAEIKIIQCKAMKITNYQFIEKLASLPFVEQIWLYGSRARGTEKTRSDVDLLIACPQASRENWSQVVAIVEKADTLLKIDCVRFDTLNKESTFYSNIMQDYKLLYDKRTGFMGTRTIQDTFQSLAQALQRLKETLTSPLIDKDLNYRDAAIQRFEFTLEAFWKALKRYLSYEKVDVNTPREVMQKAYQFSWIDDESVWLDMLDDRNKSSHVYSEDEAQRIFQNIRNTYYPVMQRTYDRLQEKIKALK